MSSYFTRRAVCPACQNTAGQTLFESGYTESPIKEYLDEFYSLQGGVEFEYLSEGRFILYECSACSLVYQQEIPNDFLMLRLYEHWIDPQKVFEWHRQADDAAYYHGLSRQVANLIQYFQVTPDQLKVMDFGMGWAQWCRVAKSFGCEVYGAELSPARIENARKWGIGIVNWDELPAYQFDFINAEQVFEHLSDPLDTLSYLKKAIRPGGLIRIAVPDGWNIKRKLKNANWTADKNASSSLNEVAPLEHINCFNHDALLTMAAKAGLKEATVPETFTASMKDLAKALLKPLYYTLRGRKGTAVYLASETA